jgi:hypothetical protein
VNLLFNAALEIERFCRQQEWQCCVIGGLAVQRWGDPRQTRDVDLTLVTGLGTEASYVDPLLRHYQPRIAEARGSTSKGSWFGRADALIERSSRRSCDRCSN